MISCAWVLIGDILLQVDLTQPEMSQKLLDNKITALTINSPGIVVTANIGCQLHLQSKSPVPVKHWVELLDSVMQQPLQSCG